MTTRQEAPMSEDHPDAVGLCATGLRWALLLALATWSVVFWLVGTLTRR